MSILGWNDTGTLQVVVDNPRGAKKALDGANVQYTESTAEVVELPNKPGSHITTHPHDSWVVGDQPYVSLHVLKPL